MKRLFAAGLAAALLAGTALLGFSDFSARLRAPLLLPEAQTLEIAPGTGVNAVVDDLGKRGVLRGPLLPLYLRTYARFSGLASELKAGEYQLRPGMSAVEALELFASGRVLLHSLRIGEASRFWELKQLMRGSDVLQHGLADAGDDEIMRALGRPGQHPEGRFFPDTYQLPKQTPDLAFLRRAAEAMDAVLAQEWEQREAGLPYSSAEQALIMASIVEKETGVADERGMVAGVFVNRLRAGMRLQTDPTLIYSLGEAFDGNLRQKDLVTDTPYNSYTRAGLPPTPICMPSRASIHAALHPAPTKALFFVARGDGSHQYSETLEQHNGAVRRYQLKQPEPPAKKPATKPAKPTKKSARRHEKKN